MKLKKTTLIYINIVVIICILTISVLLLKKYFLSDTYSSKFFCIGKFDWEKIDKLNTEYKKPRRFLKEADSYLIKVSEYLNDYHLINRKEKITFYYGAKDFFGGYSKPYIILKKSNFKQYFFPGIDKIASKIYFNPKPLFKKISLEIGFDIHIKNKFSKKKEMSLRRLKSGHKFAYKIIKKRKLSSDKIIKLLRLLNMELSKGKKYDKNCSKRTDAMVISLSFMPYLVDLKGIKAYMKLYKEYDGNEKLYLKYYNKTLIELIKDWIIYISKLK